MFCLVRHSDLTLIAISFNNVIFLSFLKRHAAHIDSTQTCLKTGLLSHREQVACEVRHDLKIPQMTKIQS